MEIVYEFDEAQLSQLHELYQGEWWTSQRTLEATKRGVANSQVSIGLLEEGEFVGFVRVLSDFVFKAMIFDVIVRPSHRGRGLGHQLMKLVREHEDLKDVKHFELYCLPEMFGFYQQHGYTADVGGVRLMRFTADQTNLIED